MKKHWLGPYYMREGRAGNDVSRTNVPDIRVAFRHETFVEELGQIFKAAREMYDGESGGEQTSGGVMKM